MANKSDIIKESKSAEVNSPATEQVSVYPTMEEPDADRNHPDAASVEAQEGQEKAKGKKPAKDTGAGIYRLKALTPGQVWQESGKGRAVINEASLRCHSLSLVLPGNGSVFSGFAAQWRLP